MKGTGCKHAVYSDKNVIDNFISGGYTVNLRTLNLSKAFDKMKHSALCVKLMKRRVPGNVLCLVAI